MTTGENSPANRPPVTDGLKAASRAAEQTRRQRMDRLMPAGGLLGTALATVILVILTLTFDMLQGMGPSMKNTAGWYHAIGLYHPALTPAGRETRHPFPGPLAVQGRYLPTFPGKDPGAIPLLDQRLLAPHEVTEP